jgi:hypothetical protein
MFIFFFLEGLFNSVMAWWSIVGDYNWSHYKKEELVRKNIGSCQYETNVTRWRKIIETN